MWSSSCRSALGLGVRDLRPRAGPLPVAKACGVKCEKFYLGFDVGGLQDSCQVPVGRNRVRHRHPAAGRLREDAGPGRQSRRTSPRKSASRRSRATRSTPKKSPAPTARSILVDPRSYLAKSVPQRMAIISAGVIMNVIFAFIFASIAYAWACRTTRASCRVIAGEAAGRPAGMQPGDEIAAGRRHRQTVATTSSAAASCSAIWRTACRSSSTRWRANHRTLTPKQGEIKGLARSV